MNKPLSPPAPSPWVMVNPYFEASYNIKLVNTNHITVNTKMHFNISILQSTNVTNSF